MAEQNRAAFNAAADGDLADNVSGDISPADIRGLIKNLADSAYLKLNEALLTSGALIDIKPFTLAGTYVPSAGCARAIAIATGGGAGKGSGNAGGSAGGTAIAFVAAPVSTAVIVGAGGSNNGVAGGSSSFGTLAVAGGGQGPSNNSAGAGGTVSAGTLQFPGGKGADRDNATATIPFGGASVWGSHPAPGAGAGGLAGASAGAAGIVFVFEFK